MTSIRHCVLALLLLLYGWASARAADAQPTGGPEWAARVLKLVVTRSDGVTELGSGVPLGGDRLATNCHVLRDAVRIEVHGSGPMRLGQTGMKNAYRDICLLTVPGLALAPTSMIEVGATRVGLDVVAVGYTGGEFAVTSGRIVGLHTCECDGDRVIQTSAAFDRGASGGGLFDREGRLVGILTFKAKSGGDFHFALPVGWLRQMAERPNEPKAAAGAFWEQPGRESGYFLAACDLDAKGRWRALNRLAREWTGQEPNNPEAWMALGRAHNGLRELEAAAAAFQRALMLDSTHAEAQWALQELEFELNRTLLESGRF